jgi:hypothetical protein
LDSTSSNDAAYNSAAGTLSNIDPAMATTTPVALTPDLRSLLAGLRWRIRLYIWVEGLALAAIWLGLMFWFGLGLDYLPVLVGASEMPRLARGVLLAFTGIVTAGILYRWIGRRAWVPLRDRSLALILERYFTQFGDSLLTVVELAGLPEHAAPFNPELLQRAAAEARLATGGVRLGQVFNRRALAGKVACAALVGLSVGLWAWMYPAAAGMAARRLVLLDAAPWPRSSYLEVVGVEVTRSPAPGEEAPRPITLPFTEGVVKVARGANVSLKVRAAQVPKARVVPQQCTIYYRTLQTAPGVRGERGSVTMSSFRDTDDWRHFWFDGKPLKGVLTSLELQVRGNDFRTMPVRVEVVDSPAVVETLLDLVYPSYMVDEQAGVRLPVTGQPYVPGGTFVPIGSQVTLHFRTNKPLHRAQVFASRGAGESAAPVECVPEEADLAQFSFALGTLAESLELVVLLEDADGVEADRPHRVFLTAVEDQPPQVEVRLRGIGHAVTPDVMIPLQGKVDDDYGVGRSWCELQSGEAADVASRPLTLGKGGSLEAVIDFRQERLDKSGLALRPGDKLLMVVKAEDRMDLPGGPHVASSDRYTLDVVTPEELLAQLEIREIGLRRRFEQIIEEMTQLRDSLLRVKASLRTGSDEAGPAEELRSDDDLEVRPLTPEQKAQRQAELRLLRVQRAIQQSQKSVAEVLGVAAGFLEIREELINNRLDTEDRKRRLKEQIADPLNQTCAEQFPRLDERLVALENLLRQAAADLSPAAPLADQAVDQANIVLAELEAVLARMQDLETYNELLEIVRELLRDHQKLMERTQQERKRQALEELKKLE